MTPSLMKKSFSNEQESVITTWLDICTLDDILPNMGCCALVSTQQGTKQSKKQIAIFRIVLSTGEEQLYALDNYCPFSQANIISRGIIGSIDDKVVVASPLYKQHFNLVNGQCFEDESVILNIYPVRLSGNTVQLAVL